MSPLSRFFLDFEGAVFDLFEPFSPLKLRTALRDMRTEIRSWFY